MDDVMIAQFEKNRREVFDVRIRSWKGARYVDLRVYEQNGRRELKPSKIGIGINPGALRDVIEALQQAEAAAVREGLIQPSEV